MENRIEKTVPAGYLTDAMGRLVPVEMVKEVDLARDALTREIADAAKELSQRIREFKERARKDIEAFMELSAERFSKSIGGSKGNVCLRSFDGRYRVQRDISEYLVFDERLQVAKDLIDECIHEWSAGARPELMDLVADAFQVDKRGRINTRRVLALRRKNIDHPNWAKALDAIAESVQVVGSREYVRVYERQDDGSYRQIGLDPASA